VKARKRKPSARAKSPKRPARRASAKPSRAAVRSAHARARGKKPGGKPVARPSKPSRPAKPLVKATERKSPLKAPSRPTRRPEAAAKPVPHSPKDAKQNNVIQARQETPKDTPAARPAPKAPAPKKPKPPAKTMQVPLPETAPLLTLSLPDVRRAVTSKKKEPTRGQLRPEPLSKSKDDEDDDGPVDATLMMSSLAVDAAPKIEDNYDYTILDEFRGSRHCPGPTRVVNTGCGGGEAAVYFAKLGYKVVGIDSDRTAVGLARERAWLASSDVDFMVGDLFETPNLLPAESFGLAIDRGAFYHLEDDRDRQRYLANIRRLLFQGGVLLLSAGFFPLSNQTGKKAPRGGTKLLLAREGGVVVNELRQAGFELLHRILRKTADSGDYGELILYLKK
jgi:SAM-dependent methyltransferase